MACRCQERRAALGRMISEKSPKKAVQEAKFVLKSLAEDAGRKLIRRGRG